MGDVHGVNVWNGPGVRASGSLYDDLGWYTIEGASGIDTDVTALDIEALSALLGTPPPYTVDDLAGLTVDQVNLVTIDDLLGYTFPYAIVVLDEATSVASADLSAVASAIHAPDARIIPAREAQFDVPAWVTVDGKPMAKTGLVLVAAITASVGAPTQTETFPDPLTVEIDATARWLPTAATFSGPGTEWYPWSEFTYATEGGYTVDELRDLFIIDDLTTRTIDSLAGGTIIVNPITTTVMHATTGSSPTRRTAFSWRRGDALVRTDAIAFEHGEYMWTDDIPFATEEVTFVVAASLRPPKGPWYPIMETSDADPAVLVEGLGLRFTSGGDVVLWHGQQLASTADNPLYRQTGGDPRAARPVVAGMNIDLRNNTATLMVLSRSLTVRTVALTERVNSISRLYLGRSPLGVQASASMDVLEVGYWDRSFGQGELASILASYDMMYGVSAS